MAAPDTQSRRRIARNVALDPEQDRAVLWLAEQEGHGIASRVVQRLVDREMLERFGPRWREDFIARIEAEVVPA